MMNSRSNKWAMTLAEMLMCICIMGVIIAITLPLLRNVMPTKEDSFRKKTNYLVEQVVSQLYGDEIMYPKKSDFYSQGFQNTEKVTINGVEYEGDDKFCKLFASKFEISSESGALVCENEIAETSTTLARGKRSFRAKDGVDWYLPVTNFQNGAAEIMVDVNGDELPNCLDGATDCSKPDRFLYYVKADGGITYDKPENVVKNKFKITVNVSTVGCGGDDENECPEGTDGGSYKLATLSNSGVVGSWSPEKTGTSSINNLDSNTRYIIKANPKSGYYVDWTFDPTPNVTAPAKRVKVYNADLKVDLKFRKKSEYCIIVDTPYCAEDDPNDCITAKLTSGCGYKEYANKQGDYKLEDGAFIYLGRGSDGAKYRFECEGILDAYGNEIPSHDYEVSIEGHPVRNADGIISQDKSYNAVYVCGLNTGDYKLVVTPEAGYKVTPVSVEHPEGRYEQDVRLGTEDLSFEVNLSR